ncbi:protein transport protein SEC16B homolog [Impatiens glandulifera]|uniref:protein transport protein SEC16B homolog n=1 Tax=Impatiens glandulifera TaxID=253017 RepID=UPI001FB1771B|nr:protein transport protein SEC16B homolog [Impatiens glandulifera]XP_047327099.1 protein transport protein SEC16B homolog [Impatiens glandulifera]
MDTSPPLLVEDQTDEDFFDKLVDDDEDLKLNASSSQSFLDESDSDEVKAFANLSIGETNAESGVTDGEVETESTTEVVKKDGQTLLSNTQIHADSGSLVSSNSFGLDSVDEPQNDNSSQEMTLDLTLGTGSGSLGSGVKELQWSAFNTDSEGIAGNGFGSYMDFFDDLGESAIGTTGTADENPQAESKIQTPTVENSRLNDNTNVYNQENQNYSEAVGQNSNQQDVNSTEYWESMYPGWKYDSSTGQWYQVNENGGTENTQNGLDSSSAMSERKSEVSYLQQTAESYVETIPGSGNFESVSDWKLGSQDDRTSMSPTSWNDVSHENGATESISSSNDVSQEKNEYPAHMVFDPQYPGWYYDMITQEWRTLESYTASTESTVIGHDQINQNGYGATGSHAQFGEAKIHGSNVQVDNHRSEDFGVQTNQYNWDGSLSSHDELGSNIWQPQNASKSQAPQNLGETQQMENAYGSNLSFNNNISQQNSYGSTGIAFQEKGHTSFSDFSSHGTKPFLPTGNLSQHHNEPSYPHNGQMQSSSGYYGNQNLVNFSQEQLKGVPPFSNPYSAERSSAGRPPHALATFGFGGKLILMKTDDSFSAASYGKQSPVGGSISILNLMDVLTEKTDASRMGIDRCEYFNTLCRQSFPGPLVGGNIGGKDLNKWIDEKIANCASLDNDFQKGEVLKLLLSLLKIACQHYGKLRSPLGTDLVSKDGDAPETAVAKLFSSAKGTGVQFTDYGALSHCLLQLPPEGQMQATAAEVQNLLVSGKKKEALHCASEGQLWGPALVLAAQLGDQFYVDIVKKMALRQLAPGSPLRTLCLLIAGQPADIFSEETPISGFHAGANVSMQPAQYGSNGMLDEWKENLALITSNRTKDDELVLIHLGDCLWKDRSDIIAAHICYIVAEANFEAYSNSARICLIGADHWKFPRTYASPDAIQRTEFYEYSKVLGNPQFILLPFQPYKLIYAYMLAEIGKVPESLKYCHAISKSLRTGRSSEVETWRQLVTSLEERIRTHQQGGYSTNLAPGKLVGKLLNLFDNTAQRVVGGLPPPAPSATHGNPQRIDDQFQAMGPRVSSSQSTMAMSSLMPSASVEPINEWAGDGSSKMTVHNRSVSEPDFGRTPRQVDSSNKQEAPSSTQTKGSTSEGASRFGRFGFGSQLFQKTVGLVLRPRQEKQAKLGETNKFYYDEKLKRWVEEGVEAPAEEIAPPPPPTIANFQNGGSDYNLRNALNSEGSLNNGNPEYKSPNHSEHTSGIPPIPPTSNQFSARGRMGVRSRYVDTFNKGGGNPTNLFQSPSVPSVKPVAANPKFFVPAPVSSNELSFNPTTTTDTVQEKGSNTTTMTNDNVLTSTMDHHSLSSPEPAQPVTMQRFPSMDNITYNNNKQMATATNISLSSHSRRTASWSGSFSDSQSPTNPVGGGVIMGGGGGMSPPSSSFMPIDPSVVHLPRNGGGGFGDDLQEVEF